MSIQSDIKANHINFIRCTLYITENLCGYCVVHIQGYLCLDYTCSNTNTCKKTLGLRNLPWIGRDRDSFQCKREGGFMYTVNDSPHCSQKYHPPHLWKKTSQIHLELLCG